MPIGGNSIISFTNGMTNQQITAAGVIKEKLKLLLLTNKGEMPYNLGYGADLVQFLFMPLDDLTKALITAGCKAEVGKEFPYVSIIGLDFYNREQGVLQFKLKYELTPGWEDYVDIIISGG